MKIRLLLAALAAAAVPFCATSPAYGTVPTTTSSVTCIASGGPLTCALPFEFFNNSDLVVTLDGVTKALGTDYTVACAGCSSGGSVTMVVNPAAGQALNVQRVVLYLNLFDPRAQTRYSPSGYAAAFDNIEMQIQQLAAGVAAPGNTYLLPRTGAVPRTVNAKLADLPGVQDLGAVADGSLTAAALNSAIQSGKGTLQLPASSSCYNLGTTTLAMASNVAVAGAGYGSPGSGASCFTYSGSGCAILFDSVRNAGLSNVDIQVNSASPTAAGICFKSGTSTNEFNFLKNVSISATGTARVAGQIGLWLEDTGQGVFWNDIDRVFLKSWDTAVLLHSTGTVQGVNSNTLAKLMVYGSNVGARLLAGNKQANDNDLSITCSRSDGSLTTTVSCLMLGDDNVAGVFANRAYVRNDTGSPSVCGVLGTNTGANIIDSDCESGSGFVDNATAVTFPNRVYHQLGLGSLTGLLKLGNLVTTRGAQIIGQTFFGRTGGSTGTSAGETVQIGGGLSGGAGLPGGDLQVLGGAGLGQTNAGGGNVIIKPGTRTGTGNGGAVIIGPDPGLSITSGVKINSSRVTKFSKVFGVSDCAGVNPSATVSLLLEGSRFSCGTAQTLTIPTAAGSSGIVQAMTSSNGSPVAVPVAVGDIFEFTMISTAAANFTLAGGAGVTILGNAVVNNAKKIWECEVTSVAPNTETVRCY